MSFLKGFRGWLSQKSVSRFIVLFSIAAKTLLIFFYTYTGRDKVYSISASYNLLNGKGWTNSFYYTQDIYKEVLDPFCSWPPGLGLLYTPFQAIFHGDIYMGTCLLEVCCFVVFILLCRGILKTQEVTRGWLNIFTLIIVFSSHDFIEASLGTDLPALMFLLAFFYCSILIWNAPQAKNMKWIAVIAGICLFASGFIRYMYVLPGFIIAILLLFISIWKRNRRALILFGIVAVISVTGSTIAMILQNKACGSPFYTGINETGIFWSNLSYWHPAAIASVIDLNFVPVQLSGLSGVSYITWLKIFSIINWGVYILIMILALRFLLLMRNKSFEDFHFFEITGLLLSGAIIAELVLLSLTKGLKYTAQQEGWTFIMEGRYHAFPVVFLQLFILKIIAGMKFPYKVRGFFRYSIMVCFLLMILNCIHQVYFTTKVAVNFVSMKSASVREQDYVFFENFLKRVVEKKTGMDILVASDDKYYPLMASMLEAKGIADPRSLNEKKLKVVKPSILIFAVTHAAEARYALFLSNNDLKLVKEIAGTKFFAQTIIP